MMRPCRLPLLSLASITVMTTQPAHAQGPSMNLPSDTRIARVVVNDNRHPAGRLRGGVLTLRLEARLAEWHPDGEQAVGAVVPAFAEVGQPARIPGPLVRVPAGTIAAITIHNALAQTLTLRGLADRTRDGSAPTDADSLIELAPGATREMRIRLDVPGTWFYYGSTHGQDIEWRAGDDSQLSGAIVVDPAGTPPARDRVFVIGLWSDTAGRVLTQRKRILAVINGRTWPSTERLAYALGDTVRWRVINASADLHPMHLHGFYFRVDARGDVTSDTTYAPERRRTANTENLRAGNTMSLTWVPVRPGNWLFHCHLPDHFRANGSLGMLRTRDDMTAMAAHDHALTGMSGLVMGVTVTGRLPVASRPVADRPPRELRLVIRPGAGATDAVPYYTFAVQRGGVESSSDSGLRIGPALVLTRGEPTRITVVNALHTPTAVHWHGIELESYFDGVGGFSGSGTHLAPVIAPGDSFVARMTPPRAGTFIYHTHVDETVQQPAGLAGPLVVMEPEHPFDPATDHTVLITSPQSWDVLMRAVLVNGALTPSPITMRAGVPQRLRLINMTTHRPGARVELWRDSTLVTWRRLAKDGADLPASWQVVGPAREPVSIGETMDVEVMPTPGGRWRLEVRAQNGAVLGTMPIQVIGG